MNKNKWTELVRFFIGDSLEFGPEHRFLNLVTLLSTFSFFISLPLNILMDMDWVITLVSLVSCGVCFMLYYLSRFCGKIKYTFVLFFIFAVVFLSVQWFLDGGIHGGISYYFISLLVMALFLLNGWVRVSLSLFILIVLLSLLSLEFYFPKWVSDYSSRIQLFRDHVSNLLTAVPFYSLTVFFSKRLYKNEKMNAIKIIEQYRKSSDYLKEQMEEKVKVLSIRERDVFKLIIEAKSNKEISDLLHISISTVKTHINNIYRKLNVVKRTDLSNCFQSFE